MSLLRTILRISALMPLGGVVITAVVAPAPTLAESRHSRRSPADRLRSGPGTVNHPVNVQPSAGIRIPEGWPLGNGGELTCLTCHVQLPVKGERENALLRGPIRDPSDRAGFCASCHDAESSLARASLHWLAMGSAHLTPESEPTAPRGAVLDAASNSCLACHDGVSAGEADHAASGPSSGYFGAPGRNHPVGITYARRKTGLRRTPLRHATMLPREVRLPGGKVSCVSCHNLYNLERYRLSVPIEGSQLCLTCHDMN